MNDVGIAAFKTAIVGPPWSPEGGFGGGADETGVALFTAPPLTEIARRRDRRRHAHALRLRSR